MKLLIISHTDHYRHHGKIVGWGPTVREINQLLAVFEEIWHIAVLQPGEAPPSSLEYDSKDIHFIPIKPFGGPSISSKLGVLLQIPSVLRKVQQSLQLVDCFHFRAPTGIGNFLIPYLYLFCRKPGWFKYAGNWVQAGAPPGYRWQRWWLRTFRSHKVTINGQWPQQAPHLLSFENPCLTKSELDASAEISKQKNFEAGLSICFVGSLTANKGVCQFLEAIAMLADPVFETVLIAGDGAERSRVEELARKSPVPVKVLGFQSRQALNKVFEKAHFIILPSENEGFPKVLSEAAAYGCIPIATDVSCIGQYIRDGENGFLLDDNSVPCINAKLGQIGGLRRFFPEMSVVARSMAGDFSYERYLYRIRAIATSL